MSAPSIVRFNSSYGVLNASVSVDILKWGDDYTENAGSGFNPQTSSGHVYYYQTNNLQGYSVFVDKIYWDSFYGALSGFFLRETYVSGSEVPSNVQFSTLVGKHIDYVDDEGTTHESESTVSSVTPMTAQVSCSFDGGSQVSQSPSISGSGYFGKDDGDCFYFAPNTGSFVISPPTSYAYEIQSVAVSGSGHVVNSDKSVSCDTSSSVSVQYTLLSRFGVVFDKNDGSGTTITFGYVNTGSSSINTNSFERDGYVFNGWNTASDGSGTSVADGATCSSVFSSCGFESGETKRLYAQWRLPNISVVKRKVGQSTSSSVVGIGTLKLYNSSDLSAAIAVEDSSGELHYEGVQGVRYKLVCELDESESSSDFKWIKKGVIGSDSTYSEVYYIDFTSATATTSIVYYLDDKLRYKLTITCSHDGTVETDDAGSVTSPSTPDYRSGGDNYYCEGRTLVITAVPSAGRKMTRANFNSEADAYTNLDNVLTIAGGLSEDSTVELIFTDIPYAVGVSKHADSASAISSVSAKKNGVTATTANYGDTVVFDAVVASGYSFAGWYDSSGSIVSPLQSYQHTVTGAVSLVAKAKVSCSLDIYYTDLGSYSESCSLAVNSTAYTPGTAFDVILGNSFAYALTLGYLNGSSGSKWNFVAWKSGSTLLDYGISGTIKPTAALDITAEVVSVIPTNTVNVGLEDFDSGTTPVAITLPAEQAVTTSPTITPTTSGNKYVFSVTGTQSVSFTAAERVSVGSATKNFFGWYSYVNGTSTRLSVDRTYETLVNDSRTIYAYYVTEGDRTVTLGYSAKSTRDKGSFALDGVSNGNDLTVSEDVEVGETVTIVAVSKNGYKFAGWYEHPSEVGDPYSTSASLSLTVYSNRTLYAYFEKDTNAVCVWEGSEENKTFEWRSKTCKAARPFNPSCCRVDTEGYPLEKLTIDMFSAPDTAYTARTEMTNIASQTARRLPVKRCERYMQICVENNNEVDAIYVGTNMSELAQ